MSEQPTLKMSAGKPPAAADDLQPQEASAERQALSEREDGAIAGGEVSAGEASKTLAAAGSAPPEQQPTSPDSERNAQSEREDGTNNGDR